MQFTTDLYSGPMDDFKVLIDNYKNQKKQNDCCDFYSQNVNGK